MNKVYLQKRRYLQQVRSWLPCTHKIKNAIIKEIESNMAEFLREQPAASYEEITARFGTPQQIASTYVGEMETEDLVDKLQIGKIIVKYVAIALTLVILLWLGAVGIALVNEFNNAAGYYGPEIIEEIVS